MAIFFGKIFEYHNNLCFTFKCQQDHVIFWSPCLLVSTFFWTLYIFVHCLDTHMREVLVYHWWKKDTFRSQYISMISYAFSWAWTPWYCYHTYHTLFARLLRGRYPKMTKKIFFLKYFCLYRFLCRIYRRFHFCAYFWYILSTFWDNCIYMDHGFS